MATQASRKLIFAGVGLAVLGAAFGGGVFIGRGSLQPDLEAARGETAAARDEARQAAEQASQREQALTARAEAAEAALAEAQNQVAVLEARRSCAWALNSLDDRNFGIAQGHVADIATRAGTIPSLAEAATAAGNMQLLTAGNLQEERQGLAQLCQQIDQALPRAD